MSRMRIEDASAFVDSMVPKADLTTGPYPAWYGWALRMAYLAGADDERELSAKTAEFEHARGSDGLGIAAAIRAGHRRVE